VEPLLRALSDSYDEVRYNAALALGRFGRSKINNLMELLRDPEEGVRWAAAIALGELGDKRSIEPLIASLTDVKRAERTSLVSATAVCQQCSGGHAPQAPVLM